MICSLVRHGKVDDTVRGGWSQQPLTDEGIVQTVELAESVNENSLGIKKIYSRDLLRAMQTAQIVADRVHLPVMPKPEFRVVNNGELAGMKNELAANSILDCIGTPLLGNSGIPAERVPGNSMKESAVHGKRFKMISWKEMKMLCW